MQKTVALIASLDTKEEDLGFVRDRCRAAGVNTLVVDTGVSLEEGAIVPDVTASEVAKLGGHDLEVLVEKQDKTLAMETMSAGLRKLLRKLHEEGRFDGVLALGGGAGTSIACAAMRALPLGVPKIMVSTLASGNTSAYIQDKDIVMFPSIVDVAGVNRISSLVYGNAISAMIGMVQAPSVKVAGGKKTRPLIAASMFGNTTPLVEQCKRNLDREGYEVLVFHATGTGGKTMESLISEGFFQGVLDLTTTELADELVGGFATAGPDRLNAAIEKKLPLVLAPGCLDMVNFMGTPDKLGPEFEGRVFYQWNPDIFLLRTNVEENAALGRQIAEKLNRSEAPTAVLLPEKGLSQLDAPGKEFWWPQANEALFSNIKAHIKSEVEVIELSCNINDREFAECATNKLLEFLKQQGTKGV